MSRIQKTIDRLAWGEAEEQDNVDPDDVSHPQEEEPGFSGARLAKALELKTEKDLRQKWLTPKLSLIGDPIWNLMLELYIAQHRRQLIGLSEAALLMNLPPTTALRHIGYCESRGMVEREPDPLDRRRAFLRLSRGGFDTMSALIDRF